VGKSCQFCTSYVDVKISSSMKLLRMYNRQFNLPCLHDIHEGCDDHFHSEQLSSVYVQRMLLNISSSPSDHSIIVFNYGLHVLTPKIAAWSLHGMIRGIMKSIQMLASQGSKASFFFRETSSQVFASSEGLIKHLDDKRLTFNVDGSYSAMQAHLSPQRPSFCCEFPRTVSTESDWRNHLIRQYLQDIDPDWSRYVGWIPFYNLSLELYDLRAESHRPNIVDCTHFIYLPTAYLRLWEEIRIGYLNRLNLK
jgi:hypothetical protein